MGYHDPIVISTLSTLQSNKPLILRGNKERQGKYRTEKKNELGTERFSYNPSKQLNRGLTKYYY